MNYSDQTQSQNMVGQTSYVNAQRESESSNQQNSNFDSTLHLGPENLNGPTPTDYINGQLQESIPESQHQQVSLQNQPDRDTQRGSSVSMAGITGNGYSSNNHVHTAVGVVRGATRIHNQVQVPPSNNAMSPGLPTFVNQHQQHGFQSMNGSYRDYGYSKINNGGMENHSKLTSNAYGTNNFGHLLMAQTVAPRAVNPLMSSTNYFNTNNSSPAPRDMSDSHSVTSSLLPLSGFGSSSSVSTATAVANIASLINPTSSSSLNKPSSSQSPALSSSTISNHQRPAYATGRAFTPTVNNGQMNSNHNNFTPTDHQDASINHSMHGNNSGMAGSNYQKQNSRNSLSTSVTDQTLMIQRELEQERNWRMQLQQRVVDLSQKIQSQHLVEKSYEDLAQKYKMLLAQMQQMSVVIERYKTYLKQLEQEKRMLYAENVSMKAQENVAHDKTMLYNILMERSKKLEKENSSLVLENETYQRQYEKCIDEISKQVVQALLTQKALQEQSLQLQDRLSDMERENSDYYEAAVREARQASSDSRLGWSYRSNKARRTHTASPSADSVRSMPAQHHYWRQSSVSSLDHPPSLQAVHTGTEPSANGRIPDKLESSQSPWTEVDKTALVQGTSVAPPAPGISIETEFPANNGSPKSTRRSLEKHPSSGSLDSAYHSRGFVKYNGQDVRYQRSVSAEALRDLKVNMRSKNDLTLRVVPKSSTAPIILASSEPSATPHIIHHQAEVHNDLSPGSTVGGGHMTDSGVVNDPFADDADDILSKHQSLIVGSMEDIFGAVSSNVRDSVIQEEESGSNSGRSTHEKWRNTTEPTPPPRPRSRCYSDCSYSNDCRSPPPVKENGPPPLPPKQYKGSRRPYKPLPAEPPESQYDVEEDSSDKNTDSESIKQEINALTSQISRMSSDR